MWAVAGFGSGYSVGDLVQYGVEDELVGVVDGVMAGDADDPVVELAVAEASSGLDEGERPVLKAVAVHVFAGHGSDRAQAFGPVGAWPGVDAFEHAVRHIQEVVAGL